jgi:hypothetical protein
LERNEALPPGGGKVAAAGLQARLSRLCQQDRYDYFRRGVSVSDRSHNRPTVSQQLDWRQVKCVRPHAVAGVDHSHCLRVVMVRGEVTNRQRSGWGHRSSKMKSLGRGDPGFNGFERLGALSMLSSAILRGFCLLPLHQGDRGLEMQMSAARLGLPTHRPAWGTGCSFCAFIRQKCAFF